MKGHTKGKVTYRRAHKKITPAIERLIDNKRIDFKVGEWNRNQMDQICPLIRQWKVQTLLFKFNYNRTILRELQPINFSLLRQIYLSFNKIQSIQSLSRIFLPALQQLWADNNRICEVKNLRKAAWPVITQFSLWMNEIKQMNSFSEMQTKRLQIIAIELSKDARQCNDVCWVAKMQTKLLNKLYINSNERIKHQSLQNAVMEKYVQLKLQSKVIHEEKYQENERKS